MGEGRRPKGEGTIRLRSDGRYEGREPPEVVPPGEKPRSFYGKSEREVAQKIRPARAGAGSERALAPDGRRVPGELAGRTTEGLRRQDHPRGSTPRWCAGTWSPE